MIGYKCTRSVGYNRINVPAGTNVQYLLGNLYYVKKGYMCTRCKIFITFRMKTPEDSPIVADFTVSVHGSSCRSKIEVEKDRST